MRSVRLVIFGRFSALVATPKIFENLTRTQRRSPLKALTKNSDKRHLNTARTLPVITDSSIFFLDNTIFFLDNTIFFF